MRVAAAPISWGVCEVPGWGHQLAAERVLAEMAAAGIEATEAGPDGFLPRDPRALLARHGLRLIGGFVPAALHEPGGLRTVIAAADRFAAAGADVLVVAATGGADAYDARPELDEARWAALLRTLDAAVAACTARGLTCALHPHVGTVVERPEDVDRVLAGSRAPLCLDTGHLLIGGGDPVALAERAGDRVAHVHLKDVDGDAAAAVLRGERTYSDAVADGLYRPLGQGALDLPALLGALAGHGYDGWHVLEQDVVLAGEDADPAAGVRASLDHLRAALR